jgi:hypothetical protein
VRYGIALIVGLAAGGGFAVQTVRGAALEGGVRNGPWSTGNDYGSANADDKTRAIVALRGLLALPKSEARYFSADNDSEGRPLTGNCSYTVRGGAMSARWWSVTVYDREGWLIANPENRYSIGSAAVVPDAQGQWSFIVAPQAPGTSARIIVPAEGVVDAPAWVPTGTNGPFNLTLRTYRPTGTLASDPARAVLPTIERGECRS